MPEAVATPALPADVQAKLDKLDALEKSNASMGYKNRAMEKLLKEAGELVQYDANGIPVAWNTTTVNTPAARPAPVAATGAHPLAHFLGDGNYDPIDQHYVPRQFLQQVVQELMQNVQQQMQQMQQWTLGNVHLYRGIDRTLSDAQYKDLAKWDSPLAKKTAEILQQRELGKPVKEGVNSWDEWQYKSPQSFREAAELAQAQLMRDQQAASAATASAQVAQGQAGLMVTPGSGSVLNPVTTPKFDGSMSEEDVFRKMDEDTHAKAEQLGLLPK